MLPLSDLIPVPGVDVVQDSERECLQLTLLQAAGAYGVVSSPLRGLSTLRTPAVLRVDLEVTRGSVGISIMNEDLTKLLSGETRVTAGPGRTVASLYVDDDRADGRLMVRTYGANPESPIVCVYGISFADARGLPPAEIKRLRVQEYSFWYYSMDLGDGVVTQAGTLDAPLPMDGNYYSRRILFWLLDTYFGGVHDKSVIEPACSGGFHTLELARQGARVTAFDVDPVGLAEARLAAECLASQLPVRPRFEFSSIYDFLPTEPADIVYCSGLLYHLSDVPLAAKIIYRNCVEGAVIQSSISTLPGELLEFAGTSSYPFAVPRGEFAFIPTRSVLPIIFEWAGFREQHWFDVSQFTQRADADGFDVLPEVPSGAVGPVYGVLLK